MYTEGFLMSNKGLACLLSMLYVNNNIDAFTVFIHKNLGRFRKRLLCCDNNLIFTSIATSVFFIFNSSHCAKWQNFLFT